MKIKNLTPHTVRVVDSTGKHIIAEFPSNGQCRVSTVYEQINVLNDIPVYKTSYGITENLPEYDGETVYIVSMVVAMANPERTDLVSPNTSPDQVVRDEAGQIFAVKSFSKY